jgi:hypothetical protein
MKIQIGEWSFAKFSHKKVQRMTFFLEKIVCSDEDSFTLNGHVSRHNSVYWASENPHVESEKDVNTPGVTVWIGICADGLVSPFLFDQAVAGERYVAMGNNEFLPAVANYLNIDEMRFQNGGALAHYSVVARNWLDEYSPQRWFGRRGQFEYPSPPSPDLYSSNNFPVGHSKE